MQKNKLSLSVIICTNGKRRELASCLASLEKIPEGAEVIVIKNPKNLSQARNDGFKQAKGEYVAFIDDDAIADKEWVKNILNVIKMNPNIDAFGGSYHRYANTSIPKWIPTGFGQMDLGSREKALSLGNEWLSGTNMIFKKEILKQIGGFNERLGMQGSKLNYGEEIEAQIKIAELGHSIYFYPEIKVKHLLNEKKMSLTWIWKDAYIRGCTSEKIKMTYPNFFIRKKKVKSNVEKMQSVMQYFVKLGVLVFFGLGVIKERVLHAKI